MYKKERNFRAEATEGEMKEEIFQLHNKKFEAGFLFFHEESKWRHFEQ